MKRYGPYRNRDGYWFWIDIHDDGARRTVLVSREALEKKLGRPLAKTEHAHHLDGDLDNNAPENLEARDGRKHRSDHRRATWARMTEDEREGSIARMLIRSTPWSSAHQPTRRGNRYTVCGRLRPGAVAESKTRQA